MTGEVWNTELLEQVADVYGLTVQEVETLLTTSEGLRSLGVNPKGPVEEQLERVTRGYR
jgi:hypothetical protein